MPGINGCVVFYNYIWESCVFTKYSFWIANVNVISRNTERIN